MAAPKSKSPFYPGQPVPVDLFAGRGLQIERIIERGVGQVEAGKPVAMYIEGEYGIGKSSIANFTQWLAERQHGLHPIYTTIGAAETVDDVGAAILEATVRSGALDQKKGEAIRGWLSKYIGEQSLFGITVHAEALKADAPNVTAGMLPFLKEVRRRLDDSEVRGIFLVLDEIDGIASNAKFAHFIKALIDTNAMDREPLPLLLMLCGVPECRREMIRAHQPIDRVFDVIDIEAMSQLEMETFFRRAFESVQMKVEDNAMFLMTHYSAGFPKIMHMVGDSAFWIAKTDVVTSVDAIHAVFTAADEVGAKYVDQQVYRALRSRDYQSILRKIAATGFSMSFNKAEIAKDLTPTEHKKLNNFLQKMKRLKVIRSGDVPGEYIFNVRMVRLYIWMESLRKSDPTIPLPEVKE